MPLPIRGCGQVIVGGSGRQSATAGSGVGPAGAAHGCTMHKADQLTPGGPDVTGAVRENAMRT